MKLLFAFCVFFSVVLVCNASCYTGFACSIGDVEQIQYKEYFENLNNYFSKNINTDYFFSKKLSQIGYNELFLFNTIV